jgi:hypothetical protein
MFQGKIQDGGLDDDGMLAGVREQAKRSGGPCILLISGNAMVMELMKSMSGVRKASLNAKKIRVSFE